MALSPPGRRGCNPASLFQFSRDRREESQSVSLFDFVHEIPTSDGDNSFPGSPSVSPADATPASPLLCSPPLAWLLPAMASSYRPSSSSSSRFAPPDSGLSAHPKPFSGPQASSITIPSISIPTSSSYPHPPSPNPLPHPPIFFTLLFVFCTTQRVSICLSNFCLSICLSVCLAVCLSLEFYSYFLFFFLLSHHIHYFFFSSSFISLFTKCPAKFMQSFPFLPLHRW